MSVQIAKRLGFARLASQAIDSRWTATSATRRRRIWLGVNAVILCVRRMRQTGSVAPGKMGGHKPKAIAGEYRAWLLERIKAKDFTLRGLVAELAERGLKVDYRSVWQRQPPRPQSTGRSTSPLLVRSVDR